MGGGGGGGGGRALWGARDPSHMNICGKKFIIAKVTISFHVQINSVLMSQVGRVPRQVRRACALRALVWLCTATSSRDINVPNYHTLLAPKDQLTTEEKRLQLE